jgi:hypothetical protein
MSASYFVIKSYTNPLDDSYAGQKYNYLTQSELSENIMRKLNDDSDYICFNLLNGSDLIMSKKHFKENYRIEVRIQ